MELFNPSSSSLCCLIEFWVFCFALQAVVFSSTSSFQNSVPVIKLADGSRFLWFLTGQRPYIFHRCLHIEFQFYFLAFPSLSWFLSFPRTAGVIFHEPTVLVIKLANSSWFVWFLRWKHPWIYLFVVKIRLSITIIIMFIISAWFWGRHLEALPFHNVIFVIFGGQSGVHCTLGLNRMPGNNERIQKSANSVQPQASCCQWNVFGVDFQQTTRKAREWVKINFKKGRKAISDVEYFNSFCFGENPLFSLPVFLIFA